MHMVYTCQFKNEWKSSQVPPGSFDVSFLIPGLRILLTGDRREILDLIRYC